MHEMSRVFVAFKYHIHTCTTWHVYLLAWRTIIVRLRCQPFQLLNFFNEWHVFLQNFLRQNKWVKVYTHTIHTAWFAQYSFSNTQKDIFRILNCKFRFFSLRKQHVGDSFYWLVLSRAYYTFCCFLWIEFIRFNWWWITFRSINDVAAYWCRDNKMTS